MKHTTFAQMTALLLLLLFTACGAQGTTPKLHDYYSGLQAAQMDVRVRADFGDRTADYLLRYTLSTDTETVTVLEPTELANVSVTLTENGSQLHFDDLILETGALPGTGLSPLEAVPFAVRCWRNGYVTSQGQDTAYGLPCTRAVYTATHNGKALKLLVWFNADTLQPIRSETYADDTCVLTCTYEQVTLG